MILQSFEADPAELEGRTVIRSRSAGAWMGQQRPGAREVRLRALLYARSAQEANNLRDQVIAATYGHKDPVLIRFARGGTQVRMSGFLVGRPRFERLEDTRFDYTVDLLFRCPDPRIYANSATTVAATTGGATAVNAGNAPTYPTFTFEGPDSGGPITSLTVDINGRELVLEDISLSTGQTLTIVTTPGEERIQRSGGVSYIGKRAAGSQFPYLEPGTNTVKYAATGGTPATRNCTFRSAWWS